MQWRLAFPVILHHTLHSEVKSEPGDSGPQSTVRADVIHTAMNLLARLLKKLPTLCWHVQFLKTRNVTHLEKTRVVGTSLLMFLL